jgi:hypothetical protein
MRDRDATAAAEARSSSSCSRPTTKPATPTTTDLAVAEELADDRLGVDANRHLGLLDGHGKERVELALALLLDRLLVLLLFGGFGWDGGWRG